MATGNLDLVGIQVVMRSNWLITSIPRQHDATHDGQK